MRRLMPLLLAVVLLLGGCASELEPVTKVVDGQKVTISFDPGSSETGTVTLEDGRVFSFKDRNFRTANYYYVCLDRLSETEFDAEGNPVLEPATAYEKTLSLEINEGALGRAIYRSRPTTGLTKVILCTVAAMLILAGVGAFFIPKGVIVMFSAPKGLMPLATKQLVKMEPSDRKSGSIFYKIVGALVAAGGAALLIVTLV